MKYKSINSNGFFHLASLAIVVVGVVIVGAALVVTGHADPTNTKLCKLKQTLDVKAAGTHYAVQNNNYAGQPECITNSGGSDNFTVTSSGADNPKNNSKGPSSYPMIFMGCHWGYCTTKNPLPIQVSHLGPSNSSWDTSQAATGMWDVAYDIWYNTTPTTPDQPNGAEIMIWLNTKNIDPDAASTPVVHVDGVAYTLRVIKRVENGVTWPEVIYRRVNPTTSVKNLDIEAFTRDSEVRGYVQQPWYMISAEAGFEIWRGGEGLATNSFSFTPTTGVPQGAISSGLQGQCMDDLKSGSADGNPVISHVCNHTDAQTWTVSNSGAIKIMEKCLDVSNDSSAIITTCNGSNSQKWLFDANDSLTNYASGKCLKALGGNTTNTQLRVASCSGTKDQTWKLAV